VARLVRGGAPRFLEIFLALYRLTVVVTWETTAEEIMAFARRRKVTISREKWGKDFVEHAGNRLCTGLTMELGDDNVDILVWLRCRPRTATQYGVLYHELHHVVGQVVQLRNLHRESESTAFLYEYLATSCNRALWPRRGRGGRNE
jgi:hypothetical protein